MRVCHMQPCFTVVHCRLCSNDHWHCFSQQLCGLIAEVCSRVCINHHWHCGQPETSSTATESAAAASEPVHLPTLSLDGGWGIDRMRSRHNICFDDWPSAVVPWLQHQLQECEHTQTACIGCCRSCCQCCCSCRFASDAAACMLMLAVHISTWLPSQLYHCMSDAFTSLALLCLLMSCDLSRDHTCALRSSPGVQKSWQAAMCSAVHSGSVILTVWQECSADLTWSRVESGLKQSYMITIALQLSHKLLGFRP